MRASARDGGRGRPGSDRGDCRGGDVDTAFTSINDVTVAEGNTGTTPAMFNVTLSHSSSKTITVHYAPANGTAVAPGDYTSTSGTVTFAPGDTSEDVVVQVRGDTIDEPNETFTVNLSQPANAAIADATGVGTIIDDRNGVPALTSSSKVVGLKVNGQSYDVLTDPVTIPLVLATLRINATINEPGRITRRAIWLDNAILPDVVVGEAVADYSGNPCTA
jgi:hypothetical protein